MSMTARTEPLERRRLLTIEAVSDPFPVNASEEEPIQSAASASATGRIPIVVFSERDDATGKGKEVYFTWFSPNGPAQTGRQIVNTTTSGAQMNPDVALSTNGTFVVAWQSENQDGGEWGVYARRFNYAGVALTGEILVNTMTAGAQTSPKVAIDASGNFVVTYVNEAAADGVIMARRFQSDGTPISEITVSPGGGLAYSAPVIAMKENGIFAVAYVRTNLNTDNTTDVLIQVYSSAGAAVGSTLFITDAGDQATPSLAAGSSFVVAWADTSVNSVEATIYYQFIFPTGIWGSSPIQANQDSLGNRTQPKVSADANDNVVVGWTQQEQDTFYSRTVYRAFTAGSGSDPTTNEIAVSDGSSMRTLMDLAYTSQGSFIEISTVGEFGGYGIGSLTAMQNLVRFTGTSAVDTLVAYDLDAATIRTSFNGVTQNYATSSFAKVIVDLQAGNDSVTATDASLMFTVSGGDGNDTILTGTAGDSISSGEGDDSINAGDGSDYAIGNGGNDKLYGGAGDDTLTGSSGKDSMYGGDGNDRIAGTGSPDQIFGEGGDDRLYGEDGDDRLDGGGGKDRLYGGENNDYLEGGSSNDRLYGQNGNDTLAGGKGNDYLAGDSGIDSVLGKEPGDTLVDIEVM